MALTQARRDALAEVVERAASWINHTGRKGTLLEVATELRTGEKAGESEEERTARLEQAAKDEAAAAELAAKESADAAAAKAKADADAAEKAEARKRSATTKKAAAKPEA